MDLSIWILTGLIVFIAGLTMSVAGFGFGLVATPLLFLFLDSRTVVVISTGLGSIIGLLVLLETRKFFQPKTAFLLGISSLIGLPFGLYLISHVSIPVLKIIIGLLVIFFAFLFASGRTFNISRTNPGYALSGLIGGMLMSGTGLGGPPVILFLINQRLEKQVFRSGIAVFFVISGIASFTTLGISGTVSTSILLQTLTFIPLVILAYFLGIKIVVHINQVIFRKIVITTVLLSGAAGIITAILALTK